MKRHHHGYRIWSWLTPCVLFALLVMAGCGGSGSQSAPSGPGEGGQATNGQLQSDATKEEGAQGATGGNGMEGRGEHGMMGGGGMMSGGMMDGNEQDPAKPTANEVGWDVYKRENCASCHRVDGKGGTVGPNLTHEGRSRKAAWIETQIADPKAHFPDSIMPAYKLSKKDLSALVDYIAGLK